MKIAVTGAMGRVGRAVTDDLAAHGHEVLAITHHPSAECVYKQKTLDTTDFQAVKEAITGCDAVVHLAAIPYPMDDMDERVFSNNLVSNYNIVLASGLVGVNRIAIASSDCSLGVTFSHTKISHIQYLPVDEEHPTTPDNSYGISKVLSERMCSLMTLRFPQLSISSLRISHVTPPERYTQESFVEWTVNPDVGPWNLWSYIDTRDCAQAFRLAVEKALPGHEVYQIAAKNTRMIQPSAELIRRYYPHAELRAPFTGHESLESCAKAERLLGFRAEYRWND